jgi:hypothetical protein
VAKWAFEPTHSVELALAKGDVVRVTQVRCRLCLMLFVIARDLVSNAQRKGEWWKGFNAKGNKVKRARACVCCSFMC